jgi:hypothetical protein
MGTDCLTYSSKRGPFAGYPRGSRRGGQRQSSTRAAIIDRRTGHGPGAHFLSNAPKGANHQLLKRPEGQNKFELD